MAKKMKCSCCEKRAFDISALPNENIVIELKCPHCGKLVKVKCDASSVMKAS